MLITMKHGLARLDNVWGVGGGQRPVMFLIGKVRGGGLLSGLLERERASPHERGMKGGDLYSIYQRNIYVRRLCVHFLLFWDVLQEKN